MVLRQGSHLWQVSDGQHLLGLLSERNVFHGTPHVLCHFATDTGVNFVEHHHRRGLELRQDRLQCEHEACPFSTTGHFDQRQQG